MIGHYLHTALLNMRRSPWLTALIVLTIAVGIAWSMAAYSVLYALTRDPLPHKSAQLFMVGMSGIYPQQASPAGLSPPSLTWKDALALQRSGLARRQAVMYSNRSVVTTDAPDDAAVLVDTLATQADMFAMFEVPFRDGSSWSAAHDADRAKVAVLAAGLADRLFPDGDAMGQTIRVDGHSYRIVGVTDHWLPRPRFHTLPRGAEDALFVPAETLATLPGREMPNISNWDCSAGTQVSRESWLTGECRWVHLWVELHDADRHQAYADYLRGYAQAQAGRFGEAPRMHLNDLRNLLDGNPRVAEFRLVIWPAFGFLLVCLINAIGLMRARFHARDADLRLRRALGASRGDLFRQCLSESALLGVAAGVLGILLVPVALRMGLVMLPREVQPFAVVDATILVQAVALALLGTIGAGLYPAWIATRDRSVARHAAAGRGGYAGSIVAAVQIALTLAVAANVLNVSWQMIRDQRQPIGIEEHDTFSLSSSWPSDTGGHPAIRIQRDLEALRALPEVRDAAGSLGAPWKAMYMNEVSAAPPGSAGTIGVIGHIFDAHARDVLDLQVVAGRWFEPHESSYLGTLASWSRSRLAVVNQTLAERLFPDDNPIGKVIHAMGDTRYTIIGVVAHLEQGAGSHRGTFIEPFGTPTAHGSMYYLVRARPGQIDAAMRQTHGRLLQLDRGRVLGTPETIAGSRAAAWREALAVAVVLTGLCVLQAVVVALGIVGLTACWILQRRQQIGIRRALGALRRDILADAHGRNLVMVTCGVAAGIVPAYAIDGLLDAWLGQDRVWMSLSLPPVLAGAAIIVLLSQFAVFWPALRASFIPPAVATRTPG